MSPAQLDRAVVLRRLRSLQDALSDLGALAGVSAGELDVDPIRRAAAERLIQVIVDLAVDINAHVATATLARAPRTGRESFDLAAETRAIDRDLAARLAPSAGMRNILVHRYIDIDTSLVADAMPRVRQDFSEYVEAIARWLDPES